MTQLETRLKDFVHGGLGLFWQRQTMFAGATIMTGYFLSLRIALISYFICQIAEFFDYYVSKRVERWDDHSPETADYLLNLLTISSVLSALSVVQFVYIVAVAEGPKPHFGPLLFLVAAALFAAINNHQIKQVLTVRLSIYGAVFVFIPIRDIWMVRPPLHSELWAQLGTVLFVLYSLIECSRAFLKFYNVSITQLDELRVERDRVAKAYEVQSQFVSVVSHELRTPLTSIKGALGLVQSGIMGELPKKINDVVSIAHKNSDRLAMLIDDLLDLQKLEAGKMTFQFSQVDLAQLVAEAVEANKTYGASRDIAIRLPEFDQQYTVRGDYDRLMQVMANVLSNAIKFSKSGGRIDVSLETLGDHTRISIQDFGLGIPEGCKDKVFGMFTQVDSSDKRETGGTGLGMSITRQILDSHEGSIDYSSQLGVGTIFTIDLKTSANDPEAPSMLQAEAQADDQSEKAA